MKTTNTLLLMLVLVLAVLVAGQGKRRQRQVQDFFPGCLDTFVNGTESFVDCLEDRGDARCLTGDSATSGDEVEEIQACLEDKDISNLTRPFLENRGDDNSTRRPGVGGNNDRGRGPNNDRGGGPNNSKRNGQRPQTSMKRRQVLNAVGNCTADYRMCARENLRNDLATLPNCTRTSLQNLVQCARNNNTCGQACRSSAGNNQTRQRIPRGDNNMLQSSRLRSCDGIRNAFLRPMCRRLSCCPDCLEAVEAVGDCFWNRVMNFLPKRCDSQCPPKQDNDERSLLFDNEIMVDPQQKSSDVPNDLLAHRTLKEVNMEDDDVIYNYCIELAPGISEMQRNEEEELSLRGGDFFDCVMDQVFVVLDVVSDDGDDDSSIIPIDNNNNEQDDVGSNIIPASTTTNPPPDGANTNPPTGTLAYGGSSSSNNNAHPPLGRQFALLLLASSLLVLIVAA